MNYFLQTIVTKDRQILLKSQCLILAKGGKVPDGLGVAATAVTIMPTSEIH
jgi:hypothetical protein